MALQLGCPRDTAHAVALHRHQQAQPARIGPFRCERDSTEFCLVVGSTVMRRVNQQRAVNGHPTATIRASGRPFRRQPPSICDRTAGDAHTAAICAGLASTATGPAPATRNSRQTAYRFCGCHMICSSFSTSKPSTSRSEHYAALTPARELAARLTSFVRRNGWQSWAGRAKWSVGCLNSSGG